MTTDIDVQAIDPSPNGSLSPQTLAELGALMATTGFTTMEARAFVAQVQQVAAQVALNMAPGLMEQVRRIQEARMLEIHQRVRSIPPMMGYISRDRVLEIIQSVATKTPRQ